LVGGVFCGVLDCYSPCGGPRRGLLAQPVAQRFGKAGIIENADVVGVEEFRHPLRVANRRQRPGDDNPVVAGQHTSDPTIVAVQQGVAHRTLGGYRGYAAILHPLWFRLSRVRVWRAAPGTLTLPSPAKRGRGEVMLRAPGGVPPLEFGNRAFYGRTTGDGNVGVSDCPPLVAQSGGPLAAPPEWLVPPPY